jgi:hypothetical protein
MSLRRHLTYANVISSLCLFLLLGGGAAYAATQLAKGSVTTNAIKAEAVTKGKLAPNSVNSKKVVNGSLTGEDIASSTLGKVPLATSAETATNAGHASSADTAANAEKLDGRSPNEFGAVLVSHPEFMGELEAEFFFSVSGNAINRFTAKEASTILPGRRFRATDFAVHLEGEAKAGVSVRVSLNVNGTDTEVCTLTAVPSTCTPSAAAIEIPPAAQVAWKVVTSEPLEARPQFALRLGPA